MSDRTRNETPRAYSARRCGTTGCEILDPDGKVVGWTVDSCWGELVAALLNRTQTPGLVHPHLLKVGAAKEHVLTAPKTTGESEDREVVAREAISHLAYHGLALRVELPGGPSEAVEELVATYFADGEIVTTLVDLATKFIMQQLAADWLGLKGPLEHPSP